jgi:hypothetical protein
VSRGALRAGLLRLEERLEQMDAPVLDLLAGGWDEDELRNELVGFAGHAPEELVEWWTWHDGIDFSVSGRSTSHMLLVGPLVPAKLNLDVARQRSSYFPDSWDRSWLSVLAIGDVGSLVVDCSQTVASSTVLAWRHGQGEPRASALSDMVDAWHELFDLGLHWDHERDDWWMDWPPEPPHDLILLAVFQ